MFPNGVPPCCIRGANGFVVVVRVVLLVDEEALILPNVDVGNEGFGIVPLEVAKVVPAFVNIGLEDVSVVPNVLFATAMPNPVPANGVELAPVESYCCELTVTNGPAVIDVPNGALPFPTDMVASVFCVPPKTFGADAVVPKVLLPCCWFRSKAGVVVTDVPKADVVVVAMDVPKTGVVVEADTPKAGVATAVDPPKIPLVGIAVVAPNV